MKARKTHAKEKTNKPNKEVENQLTLQKKLIEDD